jgi:hypothetical protein
MKDFEKFLTDLPKPAVEVPAFRDELRRELLSAVPERPNPRMRLALGLTGSLAAAFAVVLVLFVAVPEIPGKIHAALGGQPEPASNDASIAQLLREVVTPVEADRAFVDTWSARQEQPVGVRSMEDERVFSVRQFQLTDGKRMLVFTELGNEQAQPTVLRADATVPIY